MAKPDNSRVASNSVHHYIPRKILLELSSQKQSSVQGTRELTGGILYVDLVKFTELTTSLSEGGPRGAETLREILLKYFDTVVNFIHLYGGGVYQFAGDSVLAAFDRFEDESDSDAVQRLASSALSIVKSLEAVKHFAIDGKTYVLHSRFSIAYGTYHQVVLGKNETFFNGVILGQPVDEAVSGEKKGKPGEIVISKNISEMLQDYGTIKKDGDYWTLVDLKNELKPEYVRSLDLKIDKDVFIKRCAHFVSPVILEKINSSYQGFLGEFREVTSLFVKFDGTDYIKDLKQSVKRLNEYFCYLQGVSATYGGALVQTDFSDKGNVFLILFGAPVAQEKKEIMALQFALKICATRSDFPFIKNLNVGIATGPLYCGDMGASTRKGYSVLGESVNYASRLMNFSENGFPCVDKYTERSLRKYFSFIEIQNVQLKGMDQKQTIYKLMGETAAESAPTETEPLVGRKHELSWLLARLGDSQNTGKTCAVIGEAGIGKSRLVYEFYKNVEILGILTIKGACFSYEKFTPYFPWQSIFNQLFEIKPDDSEEIKIKKISDKLLQLKDISSEWVQVFANVMGMGIIEESFTANLNPKQKNERILQITFDLIQSISMQQQLLIVIEDFHWIDDASQSLIEYIMTRNIVNFMLLLVSRPGSPVEELSAMDNFIKLELKNFSEGEALEYLRLKMKMDSVNEKVEANVLNKAYGNPFFIESIVYSLREQGYLIENVSGNYSFKGDLENLKIPNSLQDVLLMRIDKLKGEEQTVLKAAAVVGRLFGYSVLKALIPKTIHNDLGGFLQSLETNDFTLLETKSPLTYYFRHILIREVAYNSILSSIKSDLHLKLAEHLENEYADKIKEGADTLCHHFLEGKNKEKSIKYCTLAAEKAMERYGNKDAIYYFKKVLEIFTEENYALDNPDLLLLKENLALAYARITQYEKAIELYHEILSYYKDNISLARAYAGLGHVYQEKDESVIAIEMLEKAMALLGRKVPKTKTGVYLGIAKNLILNEINEHIPGVIRKINKNPKKKNIMMHRAKTLASLEKIYYFFDLEKMAWANLENVILANKIQMPEYLSKAYANFGILMTGLAFNKRADVYYARGLKYAAETKDPELEAVAYSRSSTKGFYSDDPVLWRTTMEHAVEKFKEVSNQWELFISFTQIAIANFFTSDFAKTIEVYGDLGKRAALAGQMKYVNWMNITNPFCEYLLSIQDGTTVMNAMEKELKIAFDGHDMAATMTAMYHLTVIACMERNPELCERYAKVAYEHAMSFEFFMPDAHISLASAAEAAMFALSQGVGSPKELEKIIKKGLKKLLNWGKSFPTVLGQTTRVWGKYEYFTGKKKQSRKTLLKAIDILEKGQNRWQTGLAYRDAGVLFEDLREQYFQKAESIFREKNISREVEKIKILKSEFNL